MVVKDAFSLNGMQRKDESKSEIPFSSWVIYVHLQLVLFISRLWLQHPDQQYAYITNLYFDWESNENENQPMKRIHLGIVLY